MISTLAYGGISLASGGIEGALYRERQAERRANEARAAEWATFREELRASGLALPEREALTEMFAFDGLTLAQARELIAESLAARPWYAR